MNILIIAWSPADQQNNVKTQKTKKQPGFVVDSWLLGSSEAVSQQAVVTLHYTQQQQAAGRNQLLEPSQSIPAQQHQIQQLQQQLFAEPFQTIPAQQKQLRRMYRQLTQSIVDKKQLLDAEVQRLMLLQQQNQHRQQHQHFPLGQLVKFDELLLKNISKKKEFGVNRLNISFFVYHPLTTPFFIKDPC